MDGVRWNGDSFLCAGRVDGQADQYDSDLDEEDSDSESDYDTRVGRERSYVVSLMDIARPAKEKGLAKEFEVVQGVRRVIALDDNDWDGYEDDDDGGWESVPYGYGDEEKKSYSAVLRG